MKILIDARLYGLENAGLGRYLIKLVEKLSEVDSKNQYTILLRRKYFENLSLPQNWQKIKADFPHYSFLEQIKLPIMIKSFSPDIVHFPHFNIPIFFFGSFVVTIHDILMHYQKGIDATTLNPVNYLIKRLAYKFVFRNAVLRSRKIIVPSKTIKKELLAYYKIISEKVEVVYEG